MAIKVGINGFGRIGRLVYKAIRERYDKELDVVAVNDIGRVETTAHLLKYDSNYGRFPGEVVACGDGFVAGGDEVKALAERDPARLPWRDPGIDVVVESTGLFRNRDRAKLHLDAGANKVIITAPAKEEDLTREVTKEQINAAMKEYAGGRMKGIRAYSEEPLVSSDLKGDPHSSIFSALDTLTVGGNLAKVVAWYDNEWGYSVRVAGLVHYIAGRK